MADDIKDAGGLAGVVRYGVPWHGRIEGGTLYTGKLDADGAEVTRAWPQPGGSDCWLIQRPGLADPYADAAAQKTADALEGKELMTYALLSGAGNLHGKAITRGSVFKHRWIWIDVDGVPWSVKFGLTGGVQVLSSRTDVVETAAVIDADGFGNRDWRFDADVTARFELTRYGELTRDGLPAAVPAVFDYVISAGALGQSSPDLVDIVVPDVGNYTIVGGNMILRDLTPTGDSAIMEVHSLTYDTAHTRRVFGVVGGLPQVSHRESSNPLGFVQFTISGSGAAPVIGMSLLAGRAATLGTSSHTRPVYDQTSSYLCKDCADIIGDDPDVGVVCNWACQSSTTEQQVWLTADRIIGYDFAAGGAPQAHTLTHRHQYDRTDVVMPTETGGSHTTNRVDETVVTVSVGGNSHIVTLSTTVEEAGSLSGGVCTTTTTTTFASDSGVPGSNYTTTTSGTGGCSALAWESGLLEGSCGTACKIPTPFSPYSAAQMAATAYTLPTDMSATGGDMSTTPTSVVRVGSGLYSVMHGTFGTASLGSVCLISQHQKAVAYNVWNSAYPSAGRLYGARNPSTGEIAFPKTGPVNFT